MNNYDPNTHCIKCGSPEEAESRYCPGLSRATRIRSKEGFADLLCARVVAITAKDPMSLTQKDIRKGGADKEHIGRRCKRCGYIWLEKPLDQAPYLYQLAAAKEEKE